MFKEFEEYFIRKRLKPIDTRNQSISTSTIRKFAFAMAEACHPWQKNHNEKISFHTHLHRHNFLDTHSSGMQQYLLCMQVLSIRYEIYQFNLQTIEYDMRVSSAGYAVIFQIC